MVIARLVFEFYLEHCTLFHTISCMHIDCVHMCVYVCIYMLLKLLRMFGTSEFSLKYTFPDVFTLLLIHEIFKVQLI
jgi:hypothetical protein